MPKKSVKNAENLRKIALAVFVVATILFAFLAIFTDILWLRSLSLILSVASSLLFQRTWFFAWAKSVKSNENKEEK